MARVDVGGGTFATVLDGEDAASAAQRHARSNNIFEADVVLAIAKQLRDALEETSYTPPKELFLRTGGAYSRRADEAIKEKRLDDGAADCLRGMMRPGLDSTAFDLFNGKLAKVLLRLERIREMAVQEELEEGTKYAKQQEEADALAKEWSVQLAEDEALWLSSVDQRHATRGAAAASAGETVSKDEIFGFDLTLSPGGSSDDGQAARLSVRDGEDAAHAAFHFCAAKGLHSASQVSKLVSEVQARPEASSYDAPQSLRLQSAAEYLERGLAHEQAFELGDAGADYTRGLQTAGATPEQKKELDERLAGVLGVLNASSSFAHAWSSRDCEAALAAAVGIPSTSRTDLVQLMIARCHVRLGNLKDAVSAISSLLTRCDKSGSWQQEEPRLVSSLLGALLALKVGDIDKAKKMYQIVLRNDPEQPVVKIRYKVLKTFMRILADIEALLSRSQNHDAIKAVERSKRVLETVMGKDGAAAASTRLLLFECKARSGMGFHDDAIEACNTAIEQFENHDNPDPQRIAEAYAIRAEANMKDSSFDDAVADLTVSTKKVPNAQDYKEKLEEAKKEQTSWTKSEEQRDRRGKTIGHFPVNRPHAQLLDLPENIDELEQEDKCKRLKKAFHKMSLRWHPDKAKGGKRRAQRKSAELSEAKAFLELKFGCKGHRR